MSEFAWHLACKARPSTMKYRFFFFLLAAACAAPEAKPATESDVPVDGAFDSFRNPTDLGERRWLGRRLGGARERFTDVAAASRDVEPRKLASLRTSR
ncbi:MAG: hypothetical protein R3B99_32335 [Polyangiales bacterium]